MNKDDYLNGNGLRDTNDDMHGKFGMIISDSESNSSLVDHGHGKQPHHGIFESEQSGNKWSADDNLASNSLMMNSLAVRSQMASLAVRRLLSKYILYIAVHIVMISYFLSLLPSMPFIHISLSLLFKPYQPIIFFHFHLNPLYPMAFQHFLKYSFQNIFMYY